MTRRRSARALVDLAIVAGGVTLAGTPAAILVIATNLYDLAAQGALAVVVTASTLVGQLTAAALVESRLAAPRTDRRVGLPRALAALALAAGALVVAFPGQWWALAVSAPVLVASLETGRAAGLAERRDVRELVAALVVGSGVLASVLLALAGQVWAASPLAATIAVASLVRTVGAPGERSPLHGPTVGWVAGDTAATGILYPLLNSVILGALGPAAAVVFTAVSTVSGALAIPLNFLRARLLADHRTRDVTAATAALVAALAAIALADAIGLFTVLFGEAWADAPTHAALAVACLWRSLSLLTTIPFAALRRGGFARQLALLRAACTALTVAAALAVLPTASLAAIFGVFAAAEVLQWGVYEAARRRWLPVSERRR